MGYASGAIQYDIPRDAIIGNPTHWKVSDLGVVQFKHAYDQQLLNRILEKALSLKKEIAIKRHLNLRYIREAQRYIPEINDLIYDAQRLNFLSELAGTELEPYPISVICSIVTFMSADDGDGTIEWHTDGVPVTELIPLAMERTEGGELLIYQGNSEVGLSLLSQQVSLPDEQIMWIPHRVGFSTLGQMIRVLHRTAPITEGLRVTLNMNLRSHAKPFIDDNSLVYLGADNPDPGWEMEILRDVREHQLPAYKAWMGVS